MAIPTVGYFAYLEDTEGNLFGVMQSDTTAR
jgi:predicted enzyme related to lactoylglutathione lyase